MTKSTPKTNASQTVSRKTAAKKNSASSPQELLKQISSLETRMKRADTLTRKSVKALESTVASLDERTRKDRTAGKAALTRNVNQLSAKLTDMMAQTQSQVNAGLKTALANPTVENLNAALSQAQQRMDVAERAQAAAISKVNRHLSAIATAVEARIEEEAKARQASISELRIHTEDNHKALSGRVDTIEKDTAQALARVGDKIAELSGELTQRNTASELSIREKVSEVALQTQREFETYRAGLERRIDNVAVNAAQHDTQHLERTIETLTARLEGLEYAVANPPEMPEQNYQSHSHEAPIDPPMAAYAPQLSVVSAQDISEDYTPPLNRAQDLHSEDAYRSDAYNMTAPDAFSVVPDAPMSAEAIPPNPYLASQFNESQAPAAEAHIPVEFNPADYAQPASAPQTAASSQAQGAAEPMAANFPIRDFETVETSAPPPPPVNAELDVLPYADPAYAENDPTMDRMRIGGESETKSALPKLTGRNLRVAALATGIAVIGLVAAKGVFGGDNTPNAPQQMAQTQQAATKTAPVSIPTPDTSAAPIGDYADNKAPEVKTGSSEAKTLNSAAAAGDPVAQFQLGLSYLEEGRTNEGVALIRKSANQNQPAAQYRLAKLYEVGEGVSQDSNMARQLTERAATNGNRIAMHDLALYYAEGRGGVESDLPIAAKWFEKAAERGVVDSQFNLGVLFESGQGLPKNVNEAFVWYSIAAAQGDQFAKTRVETLTPTLDQTNLVSAAARIKKFQPRKIDEAANGIFRNVAWNRANKTSGSQVSQVKQVQTLLTDLGYDIGGADGSIGPKTRAAIMSFERANSLPETGRVNTALLDRLELAAGA
ncbi:SEL1-like repeat protein [Hellea balneolensis]|uniref:SEL1-like repeat protein n=1 Tax=Hellea balneolensis TaxID=287478 RepID=UPI00138AED55|nr:SEL1-like repeat protein [Hellea balneolensis]